jgi:Domain of unknown function (DUF4394)
MKKLLPVTLYFLIATLLPCRAETIVALYSNYRLHFFDSETPGTFTKNVDLTGIPTDEALVAMDFKSTGALYLLTRKGTTITLYQADPDSGVATAGSSGINWSGTAFGFDVAPISIGAGNTVIVDDADKLQRLGFTGFNGAVTVAYDNTTSDGDPVDQHAGNNPAITALAFTNNFPEAKSTVLYGIDATPNSLVIVNYSTGQLDTVGPLGVPTGPRCSFDISGTTGTAYAALSPGPGSDGATLYTIDLGTGAATSVGTIGGQFQQVGVNLVGLSALPPTRLLNISTRGRVGTGEDAMIAGFTTVGGAPTRLIIRGLGPSLGAFGISSPLPNPFLSIRDANGLEIASNDNWRSNQESDIFQSQLAPSNDLESAYIGTFAPGAYTAIVRDLDNASGIGVVEVYKLKDQ